MDAHPFLITHHLLILLQTVADPNKADEKEHTISQQESTGDVVICPTVYYFRFSVINSPVNPIDDFNQIIENYKSNTSVANFLSNFSDLDMFFHSLIFPTKHFRDFKVSKREQEMADVVKAIGKVVTNRTCKFQVVKKLVFLFWICWALRVLSRK
jgi:hypothetical protein